MTSQTCALRQTGDDEGPCCWSRRRRSGVRRDRAASGRLSSRWCSPTSRSSARMRPRSGSAKPDRFSAERVDASSRAELVELIARVRPDAVLNACDPRFNEPIFGGRVRREGHLPGHGDDALASASRAPVRAARRDARRSSSSPSTSAGSRRACWRSWGSASSRACRTCSPAMPPTSCSRASAKSACATAPTSSSRATTSRRRSRSGRRSRSA